MSERGRLFFARVLIAVPRCCASSGSPSDAHCCFTTLPPRHPLLCCFGLEPRRFVDWTNQEVTSYSGFVQEHEAIMEQYSELVRKGSAG